MRDKLTGRLQKIAQDLKKFSNRWDWKLLDSDLYLRGEGSVGLWGLNQDGFDATIEQTDIHEFEWKVKSPAGEVEQGYARSLEDAKSKAQK